MDANVTSRTTRYSAIDNYWGEGHILSLREGDRTRFEPGMVVHVVPALRQVALSGVGFSETVLVTPEGNEVLTNSPRQLS
jgi:Xaa-Pro dipeptidase